MSSRNSFTRSPVTVASALIVLAFVLGALFAPWIAPHNPFNPAELNLMDGFTPPMGEAFSGNTYLLGTDDQGRDVLSTILYGARISLFVGFCAVLFAMVLGIGLGRTSVKSAKFFLGLISITFLANSVIAAYHTGVERKWWPSFLEGCTIPKMEGNITDVLAQIEASPIVRCDEIPWTDPFLGLSMANYNVLFCLVLAIAAAMACYRAKTKGRASSRSPEAP